LPLLSIGRGSVVEMPPRLMKETSENDRDVVVAAAEAEVVVVDVFDKGDVLLGCAQQGFHGPYRNTLASELCQSDWGPQSLTRAVSYRPKWRWGISAWRT